MHPRLLLLPDAVVYGASAFYGGSTRRHCGVVLLTLDGEPVAVRAGALSVQGDAVLVAPDVARSVQARQGRYLSIQIEPQHRLYRSLLGLRRRGGALAVPIAALGPAGGLMKRDAWADAPQDFVAALSAVIEAILPSEPWRDRRMQGVVERLARSSPTDYAFQEVLQASGLSASRFSRAFTASAGLPLRGYMLWRKTSEALRLVGAGQTLTAVAHQAGFTDSSHLTRTFQASLGLAPSQLAAARRGHA
jgi:AraC-like DNA-binding protein